VEKVKVMVRAESPPMLLCHGPGEPDKNSWLLATAAPRVL
jgi:hypothetical protein